MNAVIKFAFSEYLPNERPTDYQEEKTAHLIKIEYLYSVIKNYFAYNSVRLELLPLQKSTAEVDFLRPSIIMKFCVVFDD